MKQFHYALTWLTISLFLAPWCAAQQKDAEGCKDSPLITRFPGSIIISCSEKADDVGSFAMGNGKPNKEIEGELHKWTYRFPSTASKPQVVRNLTTALHAAGYIFDYDSGSYGDSTSHMGKTWIWLAISGSGNYDLMIAVETKLEQVVTASAAALTSGLTSNGHAVVNGILFDTGKAEVKPESAAALQEVLKMLQQDPKLKVYVVGHTDNVGALAGNMELSRQRAAAVVKELTGKYAVAADRLQAYGDGPYSPVTSNDSEDGRALNRRVELVKQ
jgi:OOP family OmpA-OmpF porin